MKFAKRLVTRPRVPPQSEGDPTPAIPDLHALGDQCAAAVAALPHAGENEVAGLAALLLSIVADAEPVDHNKNLSKRRRRASAAEAGAARLALLGSWHRLSPAAVRLAIGLSPRAWAKALDDALTASAAGAAPAGGPSPGAAAVAAFLRVAPWPCCSGAAAWLIEHGEPAEARAAEQAFLRMVARVAPDGNAALLASELGPSPTRPAADEPTWTDADCRDLADDLADAAWRYSVHRRSGPVLAALLMLDERLDHPRLGDRADRLRRLLAPSSHPAHAAAMRCLRRGRSAAMRARAFVWCGDPRVSRVAVDRVAQSRADDDHAALLGRAHLLLRPARAAALQSVRVDADASERGLALRPGAVVPGPDRFGALPARERAALPKLIDCLSGEPAVMHALRAPLLADPDPLVRLAAAHAAEPLDLPDFLFDPHPAVAASAWLRWSRRDAQLALRYPAQGGERERLRLAALLSRSPHAPVRAAAAAEAAAYDPWDHTDPASRLLARRWRERDTRGFTEAVTARLRDGPPTQRVATIMMLRHIDAAPAFFAAMRALVAEAGAGDEQVTATAIAALTAAPAAVLLPAAEHAVGHADDRVRANAADAIALLHRRGPGDMTRGMLIEIKADASHRVRANALRGLLASGESPPRRAVAMEELADMLESSDPPARRAAAWAAERAIAAGTPSPALLERIIAAAGPGQPPGLRARARRAAIRAVDRREDVPAPSRAPASRLAA